MYIFTFFLLVAIYLAGWWWHNLPRWKCYRLSGGGVVELGRMTRGRATKKCAREFGPVTYIDKRRGFIFYQATQSIQEP